MPGRTTPIQTAADLTSAGTKPYRYGFNGQESDFEINNKGGTSYSAEFWQYDSRLGRRWNIDPEFMAKPWMSPYHAFSNKPILNVDPNGASDHEYEVDGKTGARTKVSDLGGDAVDFNHYKGGENDGKTEIVNNKTCETEWTSSSKNIKDYSVRDEKTNWKTLYTEYKLGLGPEKSLIYQGHQMNKDLFTSPNFTEAMTDFVASEKTKFGAEPFFNPATAGTNMTAQFVGKANYSFYEVGDKLVIVIIDSKSITSESFNPIIKNNESYNKPRGNGKIIPESNTHQTYLFILPTTVKKNYEKK